MAAVVVRQPGLRGYDFKTVAFGQEGDSIFIFNGVDATGTVVELTLGFKKVEGGGEDLFLEIVKTSVGRPVVANGFRALDQDPRVATGKIDEHTLE